MKVRKDVGDIYHVQVDWLYRHLLKMGIKKSETLIFHDSIYLASATNFVKFINMCQKYLVSLGRSSIHRTGWGTDLNVQSMIS